LLKKKENKSIAQIIRNAIKLCAIVLPNKVILVDKKTGKEEVLRFII
jgi:hypothetical protein